MKNIYNIAKGLFVALTCFAVASCDLRLEQTVDSAYLEPLIVDPPYKFSRAGESNVNIVECDYLNRPLERIYSAYLKPARITDNQDRKEVYDLYNEGLDGVKPVEQVAQSPRHKVDRDKILNDIASWISDVEKISGYGKENAYLHRRQEAARGKAGYVGINIGDKNIYFVNEKGLVLGEMFKYSLLGSIYLDKILNIHLSNETLSNADLRREHENLDLKPGENYTSIEHHWDLAYGYFKFLRPLASSEGLPAIRQSERFIDHSLVYGRIYMRDFRYDDVNQQLDTIRREIKKVIGVRAMSYLVGANTLVNMEERPQNAFLFISKGCGLLYACQFLVDEKGEQIFTYDEVNGLINSLLNGRGLWDKDRLLDDENSTGSLRYVASKIGEKLGIKLNNIKK